MSLIVFRKIKVLLRAGLTGRSALEQARENQLRAEALYAAEWYGERVKVSWTNIRPREDDASEN
jgi:hypothetical protein